MTVNPPFTDWSPVVSVNRSDPFAPLSIGLCNKSQIFFFLSNLVVKSIAKLFPTLCVVFVFPGIHAENKNQFDWFTISCYSSAICRMDLHKTIIGST